MRKILIAAAFVPLCLLLSCQERVSPALERVEPVSMTGVQESEGLDLVARTLAKSLVDVQFRTLIRDEASKKVDGDFDVLYGQIATRVLPGGKSVNGAMQAAQATSSSSRTMPIGKVMEQMPLLNISVPVNIEKWDVSAYSPLVVVLGEEGQKTVKAYDAAGGIHWLDAKKAPSYPVVVVGRSERYQISKGGALVLRKGLINKGLDASRLNDMNLYDDRIDDDTGGGAGGGGSAAYCNDLGPKNLLLTGWFSGNLSAIESWARGTPEIRMRAFATTASGTKVDVYGDPVRGNLWEPISRNDIDGTWWSITDYLFNWNTGQYGEEVTFVLHEEDGGAPKDITIPISYKSGGFNSSTTITFRVDDGDDYVGYFPRRLPFCNGSEIGNYTLKFRVERTY